jgi:hypothetical protein
MPINVVEAQRRLVAMMEQRVLTQDVMLLLLPTPVHRMRSIVLMTRQHL